MIAEGTTPAPELSFVIPIYNGSRSISPLVERIQAIYASKAFEIVLVNDGSEDDSEMVCAKLAEKFPQVVTLVQLSRNFGEHSALLAGLSQSHGRYVAVLDDDGQNPPEEIAPMLEELKRGDYDVVYGHYIDKQHSWFRNAGSRFNDRVATWILGKPKNLYLSSFKVMNRFLVDEIIKYRGPYPYSDGLIYRTTRRIGQIPVEHRSSTGAPSRYTFRKLVRLWMNMFLNFSIAPLRLSVYVGLLTSCLSVVALIFILIDKIWITPGVTVGIPTVLGGIVLLFRHSIDDAWSGRRISGPAVSRSHRHAAIHRSLHDGRSCESKTLRCRSCAQRWRRAMKSGLLFNCVQELFSRAHSLATGGERYPLRSLLLREYEKLSPRRILDVGCGSGLFALPDHDYVGIDPNPSYVDYCRRHRPGKFEQMSAEKLEFPDKTFDVVLGCSIGHHLSEASLRAVCSEIKRVLTDDGVFFFADPVRPIVRSRLAAALLEWLDEGRWFRKEEEYVDLLREEFFIAEKRVIVDQFYRTLVLSCRKKAI